MDSCDIMHCAFCQIVSVMRCDCTLSKLPIYVYNKNKSISQDSAFLLLGKLLGKDKILNGTSLQEAKGDFSPLILSS